MAYSGRQWCCCSVKAGATISGSIAMTISCFQLMLHIIFYAYGQSMDFVFDNLIISLYFGLGIFDVIVVIISIIMLYQNNRQSGAGGLMAWMILLGIYMVYEAGINTFNLIVLGAAKEKVETYQAVVVPITLIGNQNINSMEFLIYASIAYWAIKLCVYIGGMVAVAGRYRDMRDMMSDYRDDRREAPPQQKPVQSQRQADYGYRREQPPPQNFAYQQNTNYGYRY